LPIAVTAFTFIMIAGFFELIPGHESIGVVEHVQKGGYC
jgi:D-arabinose 1-dehydrogenase-like Zn-dependent alcohol dehydrogenase